MLMESSVALVTGGGAGLGYATARRLAELGASVVVLDRDVQAAERAAAELGGASVGIGADVTDPTAVEAVVDQVVDRFGRLNIAVNCAGIAPAFKIVDRSGHPAALDRFTDVIAVNLIGTFNVMRVAVAAMLNAEPDATGERGVVVNTAAGAAFDGQIGQVGYSASKAGVVGMTLPAARDVAGRGIRINAIAPGVFDTGMVGAMPDTVRASLNAMMLEPRRPGRVEEFADLVAHIVTNQYFNASCVRFDAGLRMAAS